MPLERGNGKYVGMEGCAEIEGRSGRLLEVTAGVGDFSCGWGGDMSGLLANPSLLEGLIGAKNPLYAEESRKD